MVRSKPLVREPLIILFQCLDQISTEGHLTFCVTKVPVGDGPRKIEPWVSAKCQPSLGWKALATKNPPHGMHGRVAPAAHRGGTFNGFETEQDRSLLCHHYRIVHHDTAAGLIKKMRNRSEDALRLTSLF